MTTAAFVPEQSDVIAFYDQAGPMISMLAGRNSHSGYWRGDDDDNSLPAATDTLTDVVIEHLDVTAGQRVLDVGSGLGGPAVRLAQSTGAEVVGIELSRNLIEESTAWAHAEGVAGQVRFDFADAMAELPFEEGGFDAVMVIESFVHMSDRAAAFRQIGRALRPGGRLVFTDFYEKRPFTGERLAMNEMFRRAMLNSPFPRLEDYPAMLRPAGLYLTEYLDLSDRVARYYPELASNLRELVGALGQEGIAALEAVCRNCMATGEPNYLLMTAVRE
ncbi:cyclopropane fatty-acyl-phospholipid synthase-like methyltransferase [Saccharomonospora amisosensis]|uniref:Cyclopropane fatty-acyl-phospholipid synthase-like methyltransferase n=1 Tax=Saccharomonospora amisosensis TaxID=1128677 RepID=A0A7X5ZRM4_9PSEU|nr:methyltransferase domain-containing protein [Saccharomonospora amisosensis]NIJ13029.1 cyclopropane fatty-acyl-phospholipid synthase-like methyltransferase [Saccharomonospora amisosensis]